MECFEYIIKGRVQGVGYRYFTHKKALEYDIKGYVKNLYNGDVKVIAIGSNDNLNLFLNELKRGPSLSIVNDIIISKIENCGEYKDFTIKF